MIDDFLENEEFRDALIAFRGRVSKDEWGSFAGALKSLIRADGSAGWQPIDTAPKDCSVLLFRPSAAYWAKVAIGSWEEDTFSKRPKPYWGGLHKLCRVSDYRAWEPTHWMPLPDAPKEGS